MPVATVAAEGGPDQTQPTVSLEEQLAERVAAISGDSTLDPATRDAALARLQEAEKLLQAAAADRLETTRLAEERQAAPATLSRLAEVSGPDVSDEAAAWTSLSLPELEIAASEAESLVRTASERAAEARQQLADLRNRRPLLGAELAAARQGLAEAHELVEQISATSPTVARTGSSELLAKARALAFEAKLALLEEQRSGADLREQLLDAQASAAERDAAARNASLRRLREEIARRRLSEAVAGSSDWRDTPVGGYEAIAAIARSNQELAGEYAGPDAVFHLLDEVQRESARLERAIADFAK